MKKVRQVIAYKDPFENFLSKQSTKVQDKIYKVDSSPKTYKIKIGILLRKAREERKLTQQQLADLVEKKRTYISRVENNGSNLTLKTLFDIVEKGLGGTVRIQIDL